MLSGPHQSREPAGIPTCGRGIIIIIVVMVFATTTLFYNLDCDTGICGNVARGQIWPRSVLKAELDEPVTEPHA